ncbi:mediator of RNA polymerase II transcription subunit 15a [Lactuca sativa]|uniref:mediator of RNA polymerase II transcription subunit 15a n=1 Tax=Lactuca sativa TaxID=4236 RepID=UPI000CD8682D|nr:mediator of RNA polymerase II transcription subunit 15a [Lactuca sativa]
MNSGSTGSERAADLYNEPDMDIETWVNELYTDEFRDSLMNLGKIGLLVLLFLKGFCDNVFKSFDDIIINPDYASDQPNMSVNSRSIFGGGSADKSQRGIPEERMTVSSLTPNSSTPTLQTSGHILSPLPTFVSNPASQSSPSHTTQDLPQFTNQNQPLKQQIFEHTAVQQPPTHPSMTQSTIMFGQQKTNQQMASDHLRPCPRPVSTIKKIHLQNLQTPMQQISNTSQVQKRQKQMVVHPLQNFQQNQNQTQQPAVMTPHILMPEGGQHRVHGLLIGSEGQKKPQGHISTALPATAGFSHPNEFSTNENWRECAFRQLSEMKEKYINDLLSMHKRAVHLCSQETNVEIATKYGHAKVFLEKMINFLNIATIDKIPKNRERVYNYMNFIINYLTSFRIKNGGSSPIFDQMINQAPEDHSQSKGSYLQPSGGDMRLPYNLQENLNHGVINLEQNILNFNQQRLHQPVDIQKGNGDMRLQNMPPPNSSQGINLATREAEMMKFNQYFPSRRPEGRITSTLISNDSYQMGSVNPLLTGSFKSTQPTVLGTTQRSNLGPRPSSVNVSTSSMSLLRAATAANFPSRQVNHQPSLVNQSFNSEKMKQPMQKSNHEMITGSNQGQVLSPLAALLQNQFPSQPAPNPIILQPSGQHSVSSWQVNANNVLSPQSIACSPFLLGSSSAPSRREKHHSSSGPASVSNTEGQRQEIPIIAGMFKNQKTMNNKVSDMDHPKTPTASPPMDTTPCTEKAAVSEDSKDPVVHLTETVESLPSKTVGSSMNDITIVEQDHHSVPAYPEPAKPVGGNTEPIFDEELVNLDHLNIGEETAFLFAPENVPQQKVKRKFTSASHSSQDFGDFDSIDQFFSEEWDSDSTVPSMKKKSKIECTNLAISEEIKEINKKLLETSSEMVANYPVEDSNSILEGHEGIKVTLVYRNVCIPDLFRNQAGVTSKMRPEFRIKLLVPLNYPASSPTILKGSHDNVSSEPWPQLYEEMVSKFHCAIRELPEPMSLGDMARKWDACARSVITDFVQGIGGKSFSIKYGSWESSSVSK